MLSYLHNGEYQNFLGISLAVPLRAYCFYFWILGIPLHQHLKVPIIVESRNKLEQGVPGKLGTQR